MKIILLRHGKPAIGDVGKLRMNELHEWVTAYNAAGIHRDLPPPAETVEMASTCNTVVCSDYRRSIESAALLTTNASQHIDPVFREMGIPYANWKSPKASPMLWATVFRALWFMGYSTNGEKYKMAMNRAEQGAGILEQLAKENDEVLYVGHGFMNRYIAKVLRANGWQGPKNPGTNYWAFGVYEYNAWI